MCGHSLGGGCATLLGVLLNDKADPLGYPNPNPNPDPNPDRTLTLILTVTLSKP